jgi:Ca-activated chloride channel family protein
MFTKTIVMKILLWLCLPVFLAFTLDNAYVLKGKITDEKGNAVAGASILVKGTNKRTVSKINGEFELQNISGTETIVVTRVGFKTEVIGIKKRTFLMIRLHAELVSEREELKEIVVPTYQSRSLKPLAGKTREVGSASNYYSISPGVQNYDREFNREGYEYTSENSFKKAVDDPLSTFSIDVDAASYSNIRRILNQGQLPPAGAVRVEEMINYFHYDYAQPTTEHPFNVSTELADCPWNTQHKLLMIGLQGKQVPYENLPASNLVFLIDVSGSMMTADKLPLVKSSLKLLVDQLREQDKVSLVVYAGNSGLALPSTSGADKQRIKDAIDALEAGGSTAGGAGIQLAYKVASENFSSKGNNRVILCTDGDFNVGASSDDELVRMIEEKRKSGIYLTVLGYGTGNYQDAKMQKLADKGNGNHQYIDNISEAKKVLVNEFGGTLFTIAKDVKLQVEFNPALVQGYRLIGYENRMLAKEDFNDDKKDAGEMGSGHTVTALYEIIPVGINAGELRSVDSLKYQKNKKEKLKFGNELVNIKLRYKDPESETSKLFQKTVNNVIVKTASSNLNMAAAVAEFGMLLSNSANKANANFEQVLELLQKAQQSSSDEYKKELVQLVNKAASLYKKKDLVIANEE